MREDLIKKIDELIEEVRPNIVSDTIDLIAIKSVLSEPLPGAPFGEGARKVLDKAMEMGKEAGFYVEDYNTGVISMAMKNAQPDLGIWIHGDVVPEGDGWSFDPYKAVEYNGCIIGRGGSDNKGQLAAMYNLFKIFKKLNIDLKYNAAIYVGSCEENGKKDVVGLPDNPDAKGFRNVAVPPKLSLVPDGGFPVGYCGKGGMSIRLRSKTALHGFTLNAGLPSSPGRAEAVFADHTVIKESAPIHAAHPDPNGNMITMISEYLLDNNMVHEDDRHVLDFLRRISLDINGKEIDIYTEGKVLGLLVMCAIRVEDIDGKPEVTITMRYPESITSEQILERASAAAERNGFELTGYAEKDKPYILDPDTEIVRELVKVANSVTGSDKGPFIVGGGTYAHQLPNAYVFGSSSNRPPEDFPKGRGGAHGIDEAVSIDCLQRAMKIYARAMLKLNEMEW